MTIRSATIGLISAALLATTTAIPAQAGQDEEIFVLGAAAGAATVLILGGLGVLSRRVAEPAPLDAPLAYAPIRVSSSSEHVNYCQARYRSYDAASDTFQPHNGPRRACVSPFAN